jgi:DNA-binding transcriptional regulator YhcF (GntR family)
MAQSPTVKRAAESPFATDPEDELPVGVQLGWRLRALISTGRLSAGEQMPSFRRLAEWAGVNVNTVRSVYGGLEEEGLVVSRQGSGTFVADGIEAAPQLEEIAADALRRASEAGLSLRELAIVASACASIPSPPEAPPSPAGAALAELPDLDADTSGAIEVRHELRRQIGRLEAELASYVRDLPGGLATAPRSAEAHIASVEELEQTRDTLISKLSEAQRAAEERAREEGRARAQRRELLDGAERLSAEPPGNGPLGKAMSWWRTRS